MIGKNLIVDYRLSKYSVMSRLGLTVSKRYGKAHKRNFFKRLVREAFRHLELPEGFELNVHPRSSTIDVSFDVIKEELKSLAESALSQSTTAKGHSHH